MKNPKIILWVVVAIAVVAVVALLMRPAGSGGQGVVNVDSAKLQELSAAGGVRIIDVRTPGEFEAAHIPGAENVPVETVASALAAWDKAQPIAVYCATGSRSVTAVQALEQAGFTTIYHLNAGIVSWQGDIQTGAAVASTTTPPAAKPTATPVMYEFYTDW